MNPDVPQPPHSSSSPPSPPPSPWAPPSSSAQPPHPPAPAWPGGQSGQGWDRPPEWSRPPTGPVRAPSGSRYDEQGRNGQGGRFGWIGELSAVVGLVVAGVLVVSIGGFVLAELLDAGPADADSDLFFEDPVADLVVQLLGIAIAIPIVLWGARVIGRRPAGTVSSVVGRLRWGWLGRCAAVGFPLMAVQIGVLIAWTWNDEPVGESGSGFPGWPVFLLSLAVILALVPFQAAAEEYVFRGWLVQVVGRVVRTPWPAVAVASLLFALAHGFGELSGFLLLLYSALWWGWLVIRTGGLEAVIVMHVANNLLAFGLAAGFGELASTETAADAPWQAMVAELVFAPLYCLTVARIAGRRGIERVSP
ncbi:CPBP family intramembrane glutamic endopeptidase [Streptomyces rubiginosohelvolus]|uniref:CPBP family intramembrane glutamic endopeptidase n=1 Tax=Streptomyces TaxID=1883 RepID=UPI000BF07D3B|nr:type II CAAX endopeptidase family protein [Streptomyces sp. ms115]